MPPSPYDRATSRPRRPSPSVSVVVPLRDAAWLPLLLRGLPDVAEVIVVAEPGAGETAAAVRAVRPDAVVVRPTRPGLGNALACGVAAGTGEVVVTLNGDGSTDPAEIPRFVAALVGGADVVLGSRYAGGGRDLTGNRLRRWADLLLIWCVNVLFGTGRTDPGFGYVAFWRDAIDRLDLPDPLEAGTGWGEGPEIGPLLTLRPEVRGLTVAEVGSVAYPRIRPAARTDRAGLWLWLRAMAGEYALLSRAQARRSTVLAGAALSSPFAPGRNALTLVSGNPAGRVAAARVPAQRAPVSAVPDPGPAAGADGRNWAATDRRPVAEPSWAPARRRPSPRRDNEPSPSRPAAVNTSRPAAGTGARPAATTGWGTANARPPAWPAGHRAGRTDPKPRSAEDNRPDPGAASPVRNTSRGDIGARRRRVEGHRQPRPDLRVINGEGTGTSLGRSGRLRAVPRKDQGH